MKRRLPWMLLGAFIAAVSAPALAVHRTPALADLVAQVGCEFGNDGATDTDTQCSNDAGMFVCELLRKQGRLDACGIAPSASKIPDMDSLRDADFLAGAKMDKLAAVEPCVVWNYADAYVAPNRERWQRACATQVLDALHCRDGACPRPALPLCAALRRAGLPVTCKAL